MQQTGPTPRHALNAAAVEGDSELHSDLVVVRHPGRDLKLNLVVPATWKRSAKS